MCCDLNILPHGSVDSNLTGTSVSDNIHTLHYIEDKFQQVIQATLDLLKDDKRARGKGFRLSVVLLILLKDKVHIFLDLTPAALQNGYGRSESFR